MNVNESISVIISALKHEKAGRMFDNPDGIELLELVAKILFGAVCGYDIVDRIHDLHLYSATNNYMDMIIENIHFQNRGYQYLIDGSYPSRFYFVDKESCELYFLNRYEYIAFLIDYVTENNIADALKPDFVVGHEDLFDNVQYTILRFCKLNKIEL